MVFDVRLGLASSELLILSWGFSFELQAPAWVLSGYYNVTVREFRELDELASKLKPAIIEWLSPKQICTPGVGWQILLKL